MKQKERKRCLVCSVGAVRGQRKVKGRDEIRGDGKVLNRHPSNPTDLLSVPFLCCAVAVVVLNEKKQHPQFHQPINIGWGFQ